MKPAVQFVRWFNRSVPWNQPKHSLFKRVERFIESDRGLKSYDNILGAFTMDLDLGRQSERWIYMNCYDLVTVSLIQRLLEPGDLYVDAGANLGYFVLIASKRVGPQGKVMAFEPQEKAIRRLQANLQHNQVENVQVVTKGCWNEAGVATLHDFTDGHLGEASMAVIGDKIVNGQFEIQTARIDDVVSEPPKLIKMDVEGAELGALKGAQQVLFEGDRLPHLIIELNPRTCRSFGYKPMDIVNWLCERHPAYRLHWIKSKRPVRVSRDALGEMFEREVDKLRNVWFEP